MGAGKHGGFGNTYGSKHSNLSNNPKKRNSDNCKSYHTRESLIKGIDGYTGLYLRLSLPKLEAVTSALMY